MSLKKIVAAIGAIGAVGAVTAYVTHRVDTNTKNINDAVARLASKTSVDVEESIVAAAAERAAQVAANKAIKVVESDILDKVSKSVNDVYKDVLDTVGDKFAKRCDDELNFADFKSDVEKRAAGLIVKNYAKRIDKYTDDLFNLSTGIGRGPKIITF